MPRFERRPVVIEAFQMTKERKTDQSDWPEWLLRAWNKKRNEVGSLQTKKEGSNAGLLELVVSEGYWTVKWDSWIVRLSHRELSQYEPDTFAQLYKAVD